MNIPEILFQTFYDSVYYIEFNVIQNIRTTKGFYNCNCTHKVIRFVDTQHERYLDGCQTHKQIDEDEYGQRLVSSNILEKKNALFNKKKML